jgi:DNA invertase Pin-like site-specific DNA recombinase
MAGPLINSPVISVAKFSIHGSIAVMKRVAIYSRHTGPTTGVLSNLRQAVEGHGDMVVASFVDDGRIEGRGKYAGWHTLISNLDDVDQLAVATIGDLPGRTVNDLLKLLATFRDLGVVLFIFDLRIDTGSAGFAVLDLINAYRAAKLSQAIRAGQARAQAAGKRIGRPVPARYSEPRSGLSCRRRWYQTHGATFQRQPGQCLQYPAHHAGRSVIAVRRMLGHSWRLGANGRLPSLHFQAT